MMRAAPLSAGLVLLMAVRAAAQPVPIVLPPLADRAPVHVPFPDSGAFQDLSAGRSRDAAIAARAANAPHAISIGPLSMDIGNSSTARDGKVAHFANVRLNSLHVLGGSISGTFDGRAATLRLSWPTSQ
jgi:hypothetical protein